MNVPKHFESLYPATSRERELASIVNYIKEGNSVQILSLPGVGRSNLLGLLAHNREIREKHFPTKSAFVHFVVVNFSEVRDRSLLDATKLMFLNLVASLRERDMQEEYEYVNGIFRESLEYQDELVMFQGLKRAVEYLAVEKKLTLILLFDRFEEYVPMLTHAFFSNLRILRNLAKYRFSVVLTVYKPLEDILEPEILSDFHEFVAGHIVSLSLSDEPSLTFRLQYLEQLTGKKLSTEVKEELLNLTGGHWKLTRAGAEAILASHPSVISGNEVTQESLTDHNVILEGGERRLTRLAEATTKRVESPTQEDPTLPAGRQVASLQDDIASFLLKQKTVQGALQEIIRSLTPSELNSLHHVIPAQAGIRIPDQVGNDKGGVMLERIRILPSTLRSGNDAIESPTQVDPITSFQDDRKIKEDKSGVILEGGERRLRESPIQDDKEGGLFEQTGLIQNGKITIPLLEQYLSSMDRASGADRQHIMFDEEKRVINKGDMILSDGLTAAEFRLLTYLLRHPERVIDREEIIGVVWKDAQTTAGVTDQAVDQLIFRIRRKIEPDPNSPIHLKTIKGRGFSFTP